MLNILKQYFTFNRKNHYQPLQAKTFVIGIFVLLLFFNSSIQLLNSYLLKQNNLTANLNTLNIITEINKIRANYGLPPLNENPKLNVAALLKAQDMIEKDYFNHYSPEGKSPWYWITMAKYNYKYAGENLALNFFNDQEAVQAWLDSPTHKENILNPNYKETGVAVLSGTTSTTKESRTIVVQMFGTEKIASNTPVIKKSVTSTKPATTTIKQTTTSASTTSTTLVELVEEKRAIVNAIEYNEEKKIIIKENEYTLLKNIAPLINQQSQENNQIALVGFEIVNSVINPKLIKVINNGFGAGLLFLGIFGIINISTETSINNMFRRKLLIKNMLVLLIGFSFVLNNIIVWVYKIRIPTI